MASLESMSDSELRKQLMEHGFTPGPVTDLTRKLYVKKLASLMSQNAKPDKPTSTAKAGRTLSRFSSAEEDSDDASLSSRRKSIPAPATKRKSLGRSARAAAAAAEAAERLEHDNLLMPSPPAPAPRIDKPSRGRYSMNEASARKTNPPPSARSTRKSIATSSPLRMSRSVSNGFDSGSDSDVPFSLPSKTSPHNSLTKKSGDTEPEDEDDKPITSLLSNISDKFLRSESSRCSPIGDSGNEFKHRLNVARETPPVSLDSPDAPYLSAFARRLSELKAQNLVALHQPTSSFLDDVKESDASSDDDFRSPDVRNGHYYSRKSLVSPSRTPVRRVSSAHSFKTSEESVSFWKNSHVMSFLILCGFGLFILSLGVVYINVTTKDAIGVVEEHGTGNIYKICKEKDDDIPGVTCVVQEIVPKAMKLYDTVYQELVKRAVQAECGPALEDGSYMKPSLTERETVNLVLEKDGLSIWDAEEYVANLVVLMKSNPRWGVAILDDTVRDAEKTSLRAISANIPLGCFLANKAYGLLSSVVFIAIGLLGLYGLVQGGRLWIRMRERRNQEVYHFVERIIEILSSHHQNLSPEEPPYLAISHVRDQLIAPQDRQKLKAVWDAAVAFIEQKESRVRAEIQPVNGEDYKVWRWLPPKHGSPSESPSAPAQLGVNSGRRKVWQGQAFDTMEGSVNSPPVSPTPCLKLRHMFDPAKESGDNWMQQIEDAILEKCSGAKILYIGIDKSSKEGCVYVKCASEQDAGKAYKALHGSWFDSQLVTVKYLRLERYYERFPEAVKATKPLRQSFCQRFSLPTGDGE